MNYLKCVAVCTVDAAHSDHQTRVSNNHSWCHDGRWRIRWCVRCKDIIWRTSPVRCIKTQCNVTSRYIFTQCASLYYTVFTKHVHIVKGKCDFDKIFGSGWHENWHFENFRYSPWRKMATCPFCFILSFGKSNSNAPNDFNRIFL